MKNHFDGIYVLVENALSPLLKVTLLRGGEPLARPIDMRSRSPFFDLCCSNPDKSALRFTRFGDSLAPGELSYHLVVFDEQAARQWFHEACR